MTTAVSNHAFQSYNMIPVKGHFFSDISALTNRPDANTQLSLFLKIWTRNHLFFTLLSNFQAKNSKKHEEILKKIGES